MLSHYKKLNPAAGLVRTSVAVVVIMACTGTAVAALGLTSADGHSTHLRGIPQTSTAAFSVLSHRPTGRDGHAASADIPSGAVLATVQGNHRIYAWEGSSTEVAAMEGSHAGTTDALTQGNKICVIDQEVGGGRGATCGPSSTVEEHGIVEVSEVFAPTPRRTVTVLVPDSVQNVTFTDRDGASYEVKVTNNVVVVEDQNLAPQPSTAVSFKLPNGTTEALQMPVPPPSIP